MNARVLLIALLAWAAPAIAEDGFVVIVHPANPVQALSRREASELFLKKTPRWPDGSEVQPVEPPERSAARLRFSEMVYRRSVAAVKAHWNRVIFAGRDVPPVEKPSDAEVVAFVQRTPGAIGYVSPGTATAAVKIVKVAE